MRGRGLWRYSRTKTGAISDEARAKQIAAEAAQLKALSKKSADDAKQLQASKMNEVLAADRTAAALERRRNKVEATKKAEKKQAFSKKRAGLSDIGKALTGKKEEQPQPGANPAKKPASRKLGSSHTDRARRGKPAAGAETAAKKAQPLWYKQRNPKQKNLQSRARYERYKKAKTIGEFFTLGGTQADLNFDLKHQYCSIGEDALKKRDGDEARAAVLAAQRALLEPEHYRLVRAALFPAWVIENPRGDGDCWAYTFMDRALYQNAALCDFEVLKLRGILVKVVREELSKPPNVDDARLVRVRTTVREDIREAGGIAHF